MRLLDITNFPKIKFHEIADPRSVRYVILSHVWDKDKADNVDHCEPTFQELSSIISAINPELPEDPRYEKLKGFCEVAYSQGCTLAWADMCCIDKTSSAELSEAIASMFYWYQHAEVCYVYLKDVSSSPQAKLGPHSLPFKSPNSKKFWREFRKSVWFTRGWTLQELIAPRSVVFFSKDWTFLGSKCGELAPVICDITRVDENVLTHQQPLESVSVAQRMSWAAKRLTTRLEDRAYSLMGLFGVGIPVIYGEQEYAFIRLQEEILRRIPDPTLLAWGPLTRWSTLKLQSPPTRKKEPILQEGALSFGAYQDHALRPKIHVRVRDPLWSLANRHAGYVLAPSPDAFQETMRPIGSGSERIRAPSMSRTRSDVRGDGPQAMNIIPPNMLELETKLIPADVPRPYAGNLVNVSTSQKYYFIPLGCETVLSAIVGRKTVRRRSVPIALLLCPPTETSIGHTATHDHQYWVIGAHVKGFEGGQEPYCRIVALDGSSSGSNSTLESQPATLDMFDGSVHLPLSAPRSAWTVFDVADVAFRAKCGSFNIRLGGWCEAALGAAGFKIEKPRAMGTFLLLPPAPYGIESASGPALHGIMITFSNCPGPSPSDPHHLENCRCTLAGSINGFLFNGESNHPPPPSPIPTPSSTGPTSSGCCSSCGTIHGDHIIFDAGQNSRQNTPWSCRRGVAVRSVNFLLVANETSLDSGPLPRKFPFKLTISLRRRAPASASLDIPKAIQDYILEIEVYPHSDNMSSADGLSDPTRNIVSCPS
ncbi:hypothetical protein VTO73DRAFT_1536 [Trametes versicolor]